MKLAENTGAILTKSDVFYILKYYQYLDCLLYTSPSPRD